MSVRKLKIIMRLFWLISAVLATTIIEVDERGERDDLVNLNSHQAQLFLGKKVNFHENIAIGSENIENNLNIINLIQKSDKGKLILEVNGLEKSVISNLKTNFHYITPESINIKKLFNIPNSEESVVVKGKNGKEISSYNIETFSNSRINDIFLKNELIQFNKLKELELSSNEFAYFQSNSLLSLKNKIGCDSESYIKAENFIIENIKQLQQKFDFVLIISNNNESSTLYKREKSLIEKLSPSLCYKTESLCLENSNNCSGEGNCVKSKDCWSCQCSNKRVGLSCEKVDYSSQANLLLWTGLVLTLLIVGGISLLSSVGNSPLPGILDAPATRKSQ